MYTNIHQSLQVYKNRDYFNNLPWEKIFLRVNRLIKQLYIETKKHNLKAVHNLQIYMVNSVELKVFVLKYIVSNLYTLHYLNKSKNNNFGSMYKDKTLQSESGYEKIYLNSLVKIKKIIKQHLIYVCTKPMLDARLSRYWRQNCLLKINKYDTEKYSYHYYQNIRYVERKLKIPLYIKENIIYFLETLNYIDLLKFYKLKYQVNIKYVDHINDLEYGNFLAEILNKLNATDHLWYQLNYIKSIKYIIKRLSCESSVNNYLAQSFKYYLKFRFLLKKIKFSKYLDFTRAQQSLTRKILSIYQRWYYKTGNCINLLASNLCNNFINQITYFLIKKDNLSIATYTRIISLANVFVNKTIYILNITRHYHY